jgi:CO/xanthine dehydrogenase Mo-binding subunit
MGEPSLAPTAPAILNAIANALGKRIDHLPANCEAVRAAICQSDPEEKEELQ